MMDFEELRDAYVQRFGMPYEIRDVSKPERELTEADLASLERLSELDEILRFFMLTFWDPNQPADPAVYATFGACCTPAGREIFLEARTPLGAFQVALESVAESPAGSLEPLSAVGCEVRLTPFEAMLVMPVEDGGLVVDGAHQVLRLVPITAAERTLLHLNPERLLRLLRAAGALVADPFRTCVVHPERDRRRRANAAALLGESQQCLRLVTGCYERMRALNAPEKGLEESARTVAMRRAQLVHVEAMAREILHEPDAPELASPQVLATRYQELYRTVLRSSIDPYGGLVPPRIYALFRVFTALLLSGHPLVSPLVYEAVMGKGRESANHGEQDWEWCEDLIQSAATQLSSLPTARGPRQLRSRGEEAAAEARRTFDPTGEMPWRCHVWSAVAHAMCMEAADLGSQQGPAVEQALRRAGAFAACVNDEPSVDLGSARVRLAKIAGVVSKTLYREFLDAIRAAARGRASSSVKTPRSAGVF